VAPPLLVRVRFSSLPPDRPRRGARDERPQADEERHLHERGRAMIRAAAKLLQRLFPFRRAAKGQAGPKRQRTDHVVILDGTMSSLAEGMETNAGHTYRLFAENGRRAGMSLYYEAGLQWESWSRAADVVTGRGLDHQIARAYGFLASRYHPGDRIFLFGYSRGAYAVRSLAGMIDRIGLLKSDEATMRAVREAYRHYQTAPASPAARDFAAAHCHGETEIEMVGIWDTVKALGLRLPLLWRLTEGSHDFHDHRLGGRIKNGFHALALHETREVYAPVMWDTPAGETGPRIEQMWFPGAHGDVGGHIGGFHAARPLANIPFVWMLERAESCGLPMPGNWAAAFPRDAGAPSVGTWRGWGKLFLIRRERRVGRDPSEAIHPAAFARGALPQGVPPHFLGARQEAGEATAAPALEGPGPAH
jgi:hypothetical protein